MDTHFVVVIVVVVVADTGSSAYCTNGEVKELQNKASCKISPIIHDPAFLIFCFTDSSRFSAPSSACA